MTPEHCWFGLWAGWGGFSPGSPLRVRPKTFKERRAFRAEMRREQRQMEIERKHLGAIPKAEGGHGRDYLLFQGPVEAAPSFEPMDGSHHGSPSLWWSKDHAWIVATEIDGLSTFVAGSHEAVADIVAHPDLEALEVTREMGIG